MTRSTRPLKVGVVGTGVGGNIHVPALKQLPDVEVVAVCGLDLERARAVASRHQVPRFYDDVRRMLATAELDAVTIAAPPEQHHTVAIAAAEHRIHILCETPMARTLAEARDMHKLARDAEIRHAISFVARFTPSRIFFRRLVDSGFLGELQSASVTAYRAAWLDQPVFPDLRDDPERPVAALQGVGAEYVDALCWWFGDVQGVAGARVGWNLANRFSDSPDGDFAMLLQFASGGIATIHVSTTCPVDLGDEIVAVGSDGMIALRSDGRLFGARKHERRVSELPMPEDLLDAAELPRGTAAVRPFMQLAKNWVDTILGQPADFPTFDDGIKVQEIIDGATRSKELNRWIDTSGKRWPFER